MKIILKDNKKNNKMLVYLKTNDNISVKCVECEYNNIVSTIITLSEGEKLPVEIDPSNSSIEKTSKITKEHPLILVCYLSQHLFDEPEIMSRIAESMDMTIRMREANAMAFFIPTNGEERMECINPVITNNAQKSKINTLIKDIEKSFDLNKDGNV